LAARGCPGARVRRAGLARPRWNRGRTRCNTPGCGRSDSRDPCRDRHGALRSLRVALRDGFAGASGGHHRRRRPRQEEGSKTMIVPVGAVLGLSGILFGIGVFGFLARRNIILMLISIEVMLNAVNLSLAGFSRHFEDLRGQVLALFVIAVAAAVVRGGLGLVIALILNKVV